MNMGSLCSREVRSLLSRSTSRNEVRHRSWSACVSGETILAKRWALSLFGGGFSVVLEDIASQKRRSLSVVYTEFPMRKDRLAIKTSNLEISNIRAKIGLSSAHRVPVFWRQTIAGYLFIRALSKASSQSSYFHQAHLCSRTVLDQNAVPFSHQHPLPLSLKIIGRVLSVWPAHLRLHGRFQL